jgi:hypothetical protein
VAVTRAAGLGLAVAVAACSDGAMTIRPVIDTPTDDDATASMLDTIALSVAHAHNDGDLVKQTFERGQTLELPGVPFGDDLVIHMSGLVDQSSVAYGRTCTIEVAPDRPPPAPHLFFSRTVKFASLDIRPMPRIGGFGVSYLGSALLIGGSDGTQPVAQVERFDPLTGQLTMIGQVVARDHAAQALFGTSPPSALVIGGSSDGMGVKVLEVIGDHGVDRIDIDTDVARDDLSATALTDGRVIVIGGKPAGGGDPVGDIDEVALSDQAPGVRKLAATLVTPRSNHTATQLGDDIGASVVIIGGLDKTGMPVAASELFKPLSEELSASFMPPLVVPRYGHTATLMPDGSVLIIGGLDRLGQPVRTLELFSVDAGFLTAGQLPMGAGLVDFVATTLPDGRILLTGGRASPGSPALDSAYVIRLNPLNGEVDVVATDHMALARAGHQAMLLCDGTVLVSGGTAGGFTAERYNPPPTGRR